MYNKKKKNGKRLKMLMVAEEFDIKNKKKYIDSEEKKKIIIANNTYIVKKQIHKNAVNAYILSDMSDEIILVIQVKKNYSNLSRKNNVNYESEILKNWLTKIDIDIMEIDKVTGIGFSAIIAADIFFWLEQKKNKKVVAYIHSPKPFNKFDELAMEDFTNRIHVMKSEKDYEENKIFKLLKRGKNFIILAIAVILVLYSSIAARY